MEDEAVVERPAMPTCQTCKWFKPNGRGFGVCKRYPAQPAPRNLHAIPHISQDEWCGEHAFALPA